MSEESDERHLPAWRKPLDSDDLQRYATRAVKGAERIMYDAYERGDDETALAAAGRLTQAIRAYRHLLETGMGQADGSNIAKLRESVEDQFEQLEDGEFEGDVVATPPPRNGHAQAETQPKN